MQFITLLVYVIACVSIIVLVLIQHGKGADIGAAFGAGASQTVFGSTGAGSFLMKLTGGLAAIFFVTALILGNQQSHHQQTRVGFQLPTSNQKLNQKLNQKSTQESNQKSIIIPGKRTPKTPVSK